MNVITLSREHHAGGDEVIRRLAELLGWQVLDRELVHRAAALEHVPDDEFAKLDEQSFTLLDRLIADPPWESYLSGLREAARQAAERGQVILVGRGMRHLLGNSDRHLHVRLVAPLDWRAVRGAARSGVSLDEARSRCIKVDSQRDRFRRYFFGDDVNRPQLYDVIVNTGRVSLDDTVAVIIALVRGDWEGHAPPARSRRLLTLTHELGAARPDWPATLAQRLGLRLIDRAMLEQLAKQLNMTVSQVEQIDEQPGWIFQRMFSGNIHHRYFKALEQKTREEATRGDALLVNRAAGCFLSDDPVAFHALIMAAHDQRLLNVMRDRWLHAEAAQELIGDKDAERRRFCEVYFHKQWTDPLGYHVSLNAGRLGAATPEAVAWLARRHWEKSQPI